ncbi:hypothetical protein GDO81_008757 [Engystomops pustulosus]|uniref:Uncharacterized protein n=1 Tax=Engystomops pustulosus TaxID=76066 RepID=A0AAV7CHI2_ENGPU|nr:hypothetical protein GDO81_008757 [Engystomops pustulosus]
MMHACGTGARKPVFHSFGATPVSCSEEMFINKDSHHALLCRCLTSLLGNDISKNTALCPANGKLLLDQEVMFCPLRTPLRLFIVMLWLIKI